MNSPECDRDEPLTPAGRLFLRPETNQTINCAFGLQNQIDVDAIKSRLPATFIRQRRFSSLLVHDKNGVEHWRRTVVDVDRHIRVLDGPVCPPGISDEIAVNDYLADLSTSSLSDTSKPLWEIHLLMAHNCVILRLHHALGDGISLMSMVLSCCRRIDEPKLFPTVPNSSSSNRKGSRRKPWWEILLGFLKVFGFSLIYIVEFVLRSLWIRDIRTAVSGGEGVELWPRKLATARLSLNDMKAVKAAIPHATINDVLFGIVSSGLSKYLDHRSPDGLQEGLQITGVAMVNLREQLAREDHSDFIEGDSKSGQRWGNRFGMLLLPVFYHKGGADPLLYLRRAKVMIDKKKQSLEAHFSYKVGFLIMSCFGPKLASLLNYRIVCNTSFTISNVAGPLQECAFEGNPINFIRVTSSSLPHGLTMHMVSYAGRADLQILVAKDLIPDLEFLVDCFETALLEMKEAASAPMKKP